jgi:hypothetical protein
MRKTDLSAAEAFRPADDIAWRHFWLANVMVDTGGRSPVRTIRPELRGRKESLSRRLQRLHHMRATLAGPRR